MPHAQPVLVPESSGFLSPFLGFLTLRPNCDEVCHRIVVGWPGHDAVEHAAIGLIGNDGTITFSGWFGYGDKVTKDYSVTTIWDQLPSSSAVLNQQLVALVERSDIQEQFPELAGNMSDLCFVLAAPLISRSTSYGVLVVSGTHPLRHVQESVAIFNDYCLALSLYVHSQRGDNPGELTPGTGIGIGRPLADLPRRHTLVPNALSDRQLTVLHYLAKGHSNRQIGKLMGFSESTIRHETMAIYAFFGVSGRREAVEAAISRNLVEITPSEAHPAP